ncbi:RHS repeat-associated protein [Chryseobacterium ginsenosidimutans]|uniref:RHS repeat-associated core domain-containing protein n=1 Tax=Chryseobacterium ginsenosidimutans TaxID=687846 RepID=UPI0027810450|nr:RHS repeat-associated core domain-containing protein [Chryseobacterium ginsenosidimutans]MDQ0595432.1 RHS repeat-associated protein [Chryseobacterium ginsenosidimutans]
MYNYKYNGKELQETGMYDYGARFYMPDIGRFGTIDPRSQYTHEAYSYVWNNPISFNDPTGMEGEAWSDWITNGRGSYKWDPNIKGPDNTPDGLELCR